MKKNAILKHICFPLLLTFITPCYGQKSEYFFQYGMRDKAENLLFYNLGNGIYRYDAVSWKSSHFTKQYGFNDNNSESIYEDEAGNPWFSTNKGVCRYDGKSFTRFSTKEVHTNSDVFSIIENLDGNIWVCTRAGLFRLH